MYKMDFHHFLLITVATGATGALIGYLIKIFSGGQVEDYYKMSKEALSEDTCPNCGWVLDYYQDTYGCHVGPLFCFNSDCNYNTEEKKDKAK